MHSLMRKKYQIIIIQVAFWLVLACCSGRILYAGEDANLYKKASQFAKQGDREFAFMNYRAILKGYPKSRFTEKALFANAEYYSILTKYGDAKVHFEDYVKDFPDSKGKFFALVHLWKLAERKGDEALLAEYTSQIASNEQMSFIFRDRKEIFFQSPLACQYRAVIQIDTIKIFLEGVLFAEILYTD